MPRNPHKQRCTARVRDRAGRPHRPCRAWAVPHSDPPRCNMHHARRRRCQALTDRGAPCRIKPLPGSTLCHIHARASAEHAPACSSDPLRTAQPGETRPTARSGATRRCNVYISDASGSPRPCRGWALAGSDPPRCMSHARRSHGDDDCTVPPSRRCQALTAAGKPCANWALRPRTDSTPPPDKTPRLCAVHARLTTMPQPQDRDVDRPVRRACSAIVGDPSGRKRSCRRWALRHSDPPLCFVHARGARWRLPGPHDDDDRCTARNLAGKRCRRWALRRRRASGAAPLCWLHAHPHRHGGIRHSYYRRVPHFTRAQRAALAALTADQKRPLAAELALARLKFHLLLAYLKRDDLSPRRRLSATRLAFRNVRTISRLLRARKTLRDNP